MLTIVLLPASLGPRNAGIFPLRTSKDTSWTAIRPPKVFVRWPTAIMDVNSKRRRVIRKIVQQSTVLIHRLTILAFNGPRNALQTMKVSARSRSFRVNTRSALLQAGSSRTTDLIIPGSSPDETGGVHQQPSTLTHTFDRPPSVNSPLSLKNSMSIALCSSAALQARSYSSLSVPL